MVCRSLSACVLVSAAWFACGSTTCAHLGIDDQIVEVTQRLDAAPNDVGLLIRRAELHRTHRDWEAARKDLARAREVQPDLDAVDLALGALELDANRPAEAVAAFDRFLTKRPRHVLALGMRGRAYGRLGNAAAAAGSYDLALAHHDPDSPPRPELYLHRARALLALEPIPFERALQGLDEGLVRLGDPVTLALLAVEIEERRENWDGAIARVDRLIAGPGRDETWLIRRGEIEERAGRPAAAARSYRAALSAIEQLPASRRRNRAVEKLIQQATGSLSRLGVQPEPAMPQTAPSPAAAVENTESGSLPRR